MVQIEIDGKPVEVKEGTTVINAAHQIGTYIPHFCYHKKLSIAANCRMCLVEIEKAPKPMPACATPVNAGMKVFTKSTKAIEAQKSVMEFLLINHPLDCPICDQGGECQLQDLTVGYGKSNSRYQEEKRVVFHKNVGPLISMEEMSRCIHCTRCVRFGQEIAGVMELGMLNRGEHSEITAFVGQTVDSELSGNMIDICPVGALTSKPFRYAARTWELGRKKSVSPHDSLGTNIIVQTKADEVKRVVPLENEQVNECWISDKDRFAYEGLRSDDRITMPMVKQNNEWIECDWQDALEYVQSGLQGVKADHGADSIATLAHPISSVEELYLLQKLMKDFGSTKIETRLRQVDNQIAPGTNWLGMPVEKLETLDRCLVIGSFLRKDHPLLAARLRKAAKSRLQLLRIDSGSDSWLIDKTQGIKAAPSTWLNVLMELAAAIAHEKGIASPCGQMEIADTTRGFAQKLISGENKAVLIGNTALAHPNYSQIDAIATWIANAVNATIGFLGDGANFVGAQVVGAVSQFGVQEILNSNAKAFVLLNMEPTVDLPDPILAKLALQNAQTVIALSAYASEDLLELADVILPITPFAEQAGTYINIAGDIQTSQASVRPLGQARPAWKVLRVLGGLLDLPNFNFNTVDEVKSSAIGHLGEKVTMPLHESIAVNAQLTPVTDAYERLADVPIHFTDAIVRRSSALKLTVDSKKALKVGVPRKLFEEMNLKEGDAVRISQGESQVVMPVTLESELVDGVIRLSAATPASALLGSMFGQLTLERV
ncbi:NADH-quinone oxidoreductase subunit NuoG [Polynucleobacter kasalickyi]|uniref:NADH-quinone oxidoreductase n=1 Tax=Polynucleobacter kasalickyi TaxID=1938817 RepID=A0A1W1ZU14_9BURK|nr:NADH-quinone oxidoreductase subunit NuoG [Polynucleobacter kasalickyi]SMC51955.1 NADH dehydrogenase subunit G [Polynucleobacter kasalickyi]